MYFANQPLLFASDYFHLDFDHPSEFDAHLRARFTPEECSGVLHENATEVFDLPI